MEPWYSSALGRFRTIAIIEGISFLVLLFIAMPLKYFAGIPEVVTWVGWAHGVLFVLYMLAGLNVQRALNWGRKKVIPAVLAAFIPFGPFLLDKKILREERR